MIDKERIRIVNLADCPEHFDTVCLWLWEEWGKRDGSSVEDIAYRTKYCLYKNRVPMTFVALLDNIPIATGSLWTSDVEFRQDLMPWLAALYVVPQMRGQGIGTYMQNFLLSEAKRLSFPTLYLMTDHEGYYEKLGWSFIEQAPLSGGRKTRLYEYSLKSK